MTAARRTPRAAGWIVGRFVGSGHFNISPKHALEVAPGTVRGPERAAGRAGRGGRRICDRFHAEVTGAPVTRIRPMEDDARTGGGRCNRAAEPTAERGVSGHRASGILTPTDAPNFRDD
ncbi:hypothetical protein Bcep18194_A6506 [Burkholderia lata]|uniref:Uncharacterized protein n=1 Tax=Burkholderia lata (strain ATCC 17760 / DSM 23089 / LMG 22485 / NCIMB 9086 / R18194 / 383) TaxID=482957 RepID=Q39BR6_BURL3|nr:hypothetical protein Bcep18194_A6506 [Burkholderia lata]